MSTLPSGTVTFVFTDVEGSTALLKRLGDDYGELIARHRKLVRKTFGKHGGVEIDMQGDAFFFAFARARDAVAGAVAVQRAHAEQSWPGGEQVLVRMGLHTGEPALGEEGYLGLDVVRAARLGTAGRGGQVLLSGATRALLGSTLPKESPSGPSVSAASRTSTSPSRSTSSRSTASSSARARLRPSRRATGSAAPRSWRAT